MKREDRLLYSAVIPAYNEEERITGALSILQRALETLEDYEIIVVANGCADNTVRVVNSLMNRNPKIKLIVSPTPLGKGGAVIEGLKHIKGDDACFIDADESFDCEDIIKVLGHLDRYDIVIGSRWKENSALTIEQPIIHKVASRIFNLLVRLLFGLKFEDTQCGLKAFRKSAVDFIIPKMVTKGFEFDVELLWRFKGNGFSIFETPVRCTYNRGSKFSLLKDSWKMLFSLVKLRFSGKNSALIVKPSNIEG